MLKTHLQPIVAYFFNPSSSSNTGTSKTNVRDSHLQPMIDRLVDANRVDTSLPQPSLPKPSRFKSSLEQIWRSMTRINPDPRVKQQFDRSGQPYWQVYDPMTNQSHFFFVEEEVYQWLERRYYQ